MIADTSEALLSLARANNIALIATTAFSLAGILSWRPNAETQSDAFNAFYHLADITFWMAMISTLTLATLAANVAN